MKKTLCLLLCVLAAFCFAACGGEEEEEQVTAYTYEIGMLTAAEELSIDDENYTQAVWEGVRQFAEEQGVTYKYYEPDAPDAGGQLARLSEAIAEGVRVVVAAGPEVAEAIYEAQDLYPDVKFIYLDGVPTNAEGEEKIGDNCICISFNPMQAGFLAGYSAVLEGFDTVGYMANGKTDEAVAYGYGFLQGCNEAADRYGYYVDVNYSYGSADDSVEKLQKKAKTWYDEGVDAIFAYGVNTFDAAQTEAKAAERVVIASNVSKDYSKTVITSAKKCYQEVVSEQLNAVYAEKFTGGKAKKLGVKTGGIGLDMKNSKFERFNKDLYNEIVKELASGDIELASVKSAKTTAELVEEQRLYYIGLHE